MLAVFKLPFFYPFLLGHLPWLIVVPLLGVVGALGYVAWKYRARHKAVLGVLGYLGLFAALVLWGRACESAKLRWEAWHMGGAGLRVGLNRTEVEAVLSARAKVTPCTPGGCSYAPRGLAGFAFSIMDVHGVNTEYGPDGKLTAWQTWSD